jgi:hypothetical protein
MNQNCELDLRPRWKIDRCEMVDDCADDEKKRERGRRGEAGEMESKQS